MLKSFRPGTFALLGLLGGLVGFYVLLSARPQGTPVAPGTKSGPAGSAPSLQPSWLTYENSKYHFRFSYPPGWTLEESAVEPFGLLVLPPLATDREFAVYVEPVNVGRESVFESRSGAIVEESMFHGKKALLYRCPESNPCPAQFAFSKALVLTDLPTAWGYNELGYNVPRGEEPVQPYFEAILDSFDFLD